jgi:GT2 family glycosyltransferase
MFKQTTGTHIICLDADDILEQNYFFETLQTMKEKDADIVYTDMHLFGMVDMKKVYPQYSLLAIRSGNICHVSSLMKRTVYEQTGGFAEDFRKGNEDYAMWLTAAKLGFKFAKCSKTGLNYRRHLESNIVSGDFHKNRKIMYEDLKKRFGDFYLGRP